MDEPTVGQTLTVALKNLATLCNALVKYSQLSSADTSQDIAHPVIEADDLVLIVHCRLTRLRGKEASPDDHFLIIGDEHAAA